MSDDNVGEPDSSGSRNYNISGAAKVAMPGVAESTTQVNALNTALQGLNTTMKLIQTSAAGFTSAVGSITKGLTGLAGASGSSSGGSAPPNGGISASSLASSAFGTANQGLFHDALLFPARFLNSQISQNRNLTTSAGMALGQQSFGSNTSLQNIMGALSSFGGKNTVKSGSPDELLQLMSIAGQVGAGIDWKTGNSGSPRAGGFFESARQAQIMNPGASLGSIGGTIGNYLANTGAQQQGAFMTGGAFAMIGSGGRAKTLSEWAEGILKWFMNQRPGNKRGKPFSYGEMMSQNFPGSNMDAWFQANGVPPDMRSYFWSYALGKASMSATDTTGGAAILGQDQPVPKNVQQNAVYGRLAAGNAATRTGFNLGGKMAGMYSNIEGANQWFNELLGSMVTATVPAAVSSGALSWMQYLPDEIRNLLMTFAERTNVGALGAGVLGWGGLFQGQVNEWTGGLGASTPGGDVGDVGDYGSMGTSGTAGMHPDMKKRINAMQRANPNLQINSGHRDLAKQQALKRKGVGRVSGRASAHTRGMAADLGPSSQYGWIMANAGKFGLKSGAGAGEPWHVGMGDLPQASTASTVEGALGNFTATKSGLLDWIQNLFGSFSGAFGANQSPDAQMTGIAGGVSGVLKALLSVFAGTSDTSNLGYKDVYGTMTGATNLNKAGIPSGGNFVNPGAPGTGSPSPGAPPSSVSPDAVTRARAAAVALHNAGFSGENLFKILSISGRESGWNPSAANPNTSDRGLMQMNWSAHKSWLVSGGFASSEADLLDINKNARAAYNLWHVRSNDDWRPWKASDHSPHAVPKGGPGWDPNGNELWHTESKQAIAREALAQQFPGGYGDVDTGYGYSMPAMAPRSGGVTVFQNTFHVNGMGGGVDTKKVVSQMADQLENEMRQRQARNN